jgi:hypothetical protein
MFGRPEWFRPKTFGWGLTPVTWQGWIYTGVWTALMVLPFVLLLLRHQPVEASAWLGLTIGALLYDVWLILRAKREAGRHSAAATGPGGRRDDVLYILDSRPPRR